MPTDDGLADSVWKAALDLCLEVGTVARDIHDIGKNILTLLPQANRFEVHDLGRDVQGMDDPRDGNVTSPLLFSLAFSADSLQDTYTQRLF